MARLKKIVHSAQQTISVLVDCLEWRSKLRSSAALMVLNDVDDDDDDDDDADDDRYDAAHRRRLPRFSLGVHVFPQRS